MITKCSQSLFALRTSRHHGLPQDADALHTVVNKLTYATPAWYDFNTAADRAVDDYVDSFLRRSVKLNKLGYRDASTPSFDSLCERADEQLFGKITNNTQHLLYSLLPHRGGAPIGAGGS